MKSLRVKLVSLIAMLCLVFGLVVVGIYAAEIQYINLGGSITFSVDDKSLYVQDVKMQEDNFSNSYSLKEQGKFIPGYINGEFNMNLGEFNNDYGSFKLMFDIINTVDEEGNTNMYNVSATSEQEGVYVQAVVDNDEGYIPFGSITPADISSATLPTATIVLTVTCPAVSEVDLSQISITITRREPQVLSDFDFEVDEQAMTATLTGYNGAGGVVVIPSTISVVDNGDGTQSFVEGTDYTVTEIDYGTASYGAYIGVFTGKNLTSITFPETLKIIGSAAFADSGVRNIYGLHSNMSIANSAFRGCPISELDFSGLTNIGFGDAAFYGTGLKSIILPSDLRVIGYETFSNTRLESISIPSSVTNILSGAFAFSNLTGTLDLSNCINLTTIESGVFEGCPLERIILPESLTTLYNAFSSCNFTDIDLSVCPNLKTIWTDAFYACDNLVSVTLNQYIFENATSDTACGYLLQNITSDETVYVPANFIDELNLKNSYLDGDTFIRSETAENGYYVYTKK